MTAPVSLVKAPSTVKAKPIPYGFLRYPGSWFYLIVTWVLGLFWIGGLIEAIKLGAIAVDHLMQISLHEAPFAVSLPLLFGIYSARTMVFQLEFSKMNLCDQQVIGPKAYLGFCILGWLNFFGWIITGLIALFTLPNPLLVCFLGKLFDCGMPLLVWSCLSSLHQLLMHCCAKRQGRLSSGKDCHPA